MTEMECRKKRPRTNQPPTKRSCKRDRMSICSTSRLAGGDVRAWRRASARPAAFCLSDSSGSLSIVANNHLHLHHHVHVCFCYSCLYLSHVCVCLEQDNPHGPRPTAHQALRSPADDSPTPCPRRRRVVAAPQRGPHRGVLLAFPALPAAVVGPAGSAPAPVVP